MANVIDIVVKARDEASAVLRRVSGETAGLSGTLAGMAGKVAIGGAIVAGIVAAGKAAFDFAKGVSDAVEQLDRLSEQTGVNTTDLQVLRTIIEDAGGNAGSLTTALTFLNRAIGSGNPLLEDLGIRTRDTGEAFQQLMRRLNETSDQGLRTTYAIELLGRGARDILPDIANIATTFDSTKARMLASGEAMTTGLLESGRRLDASLDDLGHHWKSIWNRMAEELVPIVARMVGQANKVMSAMLGIKLAAPKLKVESLQYELDQRKKDLAGYQMWMDMALRNAGKTEAELIRESGALRLTGEIAANALGATTARQMALNSRKAIDQTRAEIDDLVRQLDAARGEALIASGYKPPPPEPAKESAREKQLKEMLRLLTFNEAQANMLLDTLEAIADAKKRAELRKELGMPTVPELETEPAYKAVYPVGGRLPIDNLPSAAEMERIRALEREAANLSLGSVSEQWIADLEAMSSASAVHSEAMAAAFSGLQSGVGEIFGALIGVFTGVKTSFGQIMSAFISDLVRFLARLVAIKIMLAIIKGIVMPQGSLATAAAYAVPMPSLRGASFSVAAPAAGTESALAAGGTTTNQTVIINAIDARSVADQYRSRAGAFSRFQQRQAALAAA